MKNSIMPIGRIALELEGACEALVHFNKNFNISQIIEQKRRIALLNNELQICLNLDSVRNSIVTYFWLRQIDATMSRINEVFLSREFSIVQDNL